MAHLLAGLFCGKSTLTPPRKLPVDRPAEPTPETPNPEFPASDEPASPSSQKMATGTATGRRVSRAGSSSRSLLSPLCSPVCSLKVDDHEMQGSHNRAQTPSPCQSNEVVAFYTVFHKKHGAERGGHSAPVAEHKHTACSAFCL